MTFSSLQPSSWRSRWTSFLTGSAPYRFGVAAIIVLTLGYSSLRVVPAVRGSLGILHDVKAVDEQGASLEGELQFEVQESRRRFLRILIAGGDGPAVQAETQAMHGYDALVADTQSKLQQLGAISQPEQQQFAKAWQHYLAVRDKALAPATLISPENVRNLDAALGTEAFRPVQLAIRNSQQQLLQRSNSHVQQVSSTLRETLSEVLWFTVVKLLVLLLLIYMDWLRVTTERKLRAATRDLKATQDRFQQAYESAAVGMGIIALDGTVLSTNRRGAEILGYEREELIGTNVRDIMDPECMPDVQARFSTLKPGDQKSYQAERRVIRKDGTQAWVRNSVSFLQPEGQEGQYFSISEEITQHKLALDRLEFLAHHDPITNLPNRHRFEELLAESLKKIAGTSNCVALLYVEIDSFDYLKGTFGRKVADEVLADLAASISAFQRDGEVLGKLDDHVFGMLLMAAPYDEATLARAGDLREIFHRFGESGKHRVPLSASIGVAYSSEGAAGLSRSRFSDSGSEAESLLKFGRAAMLEAHSRGGDCIYVADPALEERAAQRHRIESALLKGLREDEFRVVFQPQFEVASGRLVRFEALCRWTSKELGTIPPDRFIPIAEQTGLISEIGRRVLLDALRHAGQWSGSGRRIGVAVNVSPMQFMRPDFTDTIAEALAITQLPASLLELEITEGIFIRDLNVAVARIRELQRLGVSIALDDFGTGYSSLSYLQKMPIDAVKLDRSFVSDLTAESATVSMVRSVLEMASALHLRVVTEGVETEEQLDILRELGCQEAQGYLLGRPESAEMALRRVMESPVARVGAAV